MATDYSFANNVSTTLAESISATATVLNVASGTGASFPSLASGQVFSVTLVDAATGLTREICYCTSRSGDALTVSRGQEGTTARAWSAGDTAAHYITAGALNNFTQPADLSGYATQSWVQALGYATQSWVQSQGYATQSWVTSQGYATVSYVNGTVVGNTNGYVVLPNGLIFQWGRYTTNSDGLAVVTFPKSFPNSCLNVTVSEAAAGGSWLQNQPTVHGVYQSPNQTNFTAVTRGFVSGSFGPAVVASGYYFAVGF